MTNELDTFNALKYKRFGVHPDFPSEKNYVYWVNDDEKLHRENGPAIEHTDGSKHWFLNGIRHREGGPAVEFSNATKYWFLNGRRHRKDGPAVEYASGTKYWYLNDILHRENGPAIELSDGRKEWWVNGIIRKSSYPCLTNTTHSKHSSIGDLGFTRRFRRKKIASIG